MIITVIVLNYIVSPGACYKNCNLSDFQNQASAKTAIFCAIVISARLTAVIQTILIKQHMKQHVDKTVIPWAPHSLLRANLTRVTSPPNSTPKRFRSYLLPFFLAVIEQQHSPDLIQLDFMMRDILKVKSSSINLTP